MSPEKRLKSNPKTGALQSIKILKIRQVNYRLVIGCYANRMKAPMAENFQPPLQHLANIAQIKCFDRREGGQEGQDAATADFLLRGPGQPV